MTSSKSQTWSDTPASIAGVAASHKKQQHFTISRHVSARGGFLFHALRFFQLAACSCVSITLPASRDRLRSWNGCRNS